MTRTAVLLLAVAIILCGGAAAAYRSATLGRRNVAEAEGLTGGSVEAGSIALQNYGCNTCHRIPGLVDARGLVGPPLAEMANRIYIAGVLANTPDNLVQWIEDPPSIDPRTAMPKLGVDEGNARNIAAYLYTLR